MALYSVVVILQFETLVEYYSGRTMYTTVRAVKHLILSRGSPSFILTDITSLQIISRPRRLLFHSY